MDDIVAITLFRHGLTEGNKKKVYMGWNDSPLCAESISQLASYSLDRASYDAFLSSDLCRCLHTMKLLFPKEEPVTIPEFREMKFGHFQGKTYDELKDNKDYQLWIEDYSTNSPPNGESFEQFSDRIAQGWKRVVHRILEEGVRRPFIVTHGGVIKHLLTEYAPVENEFWDWNISHGEGFELIFDIELLRRGDRCISLQGVPLMASGNG